MPTRRAVLSGLPLPPHSRAKDDIRRLPSAAKQTMVRRRRSGPQMRSERMEMAPRLTMEDRLQRLVAKCRSRVNALESPPVSLRHTPDSTLGRLAREAGYERISEKFREHLGERLKDAGLGTHPELVDPTITRDTRIHLFDLNHPLPGIQPTRVLFQEERQLSDFLVKNFAALSYVRKNRLKLRRSEAHIYAGCRVDLLAEDTKTRELVGFELKAEAAKERVVAQAAK